MTRTLTRSIRVLLLGVFYSHGAVEGKDRIFKSFVPYHTITRRCRHNVLLSKDPAPPTGQKEMERPRSSGDFFLLLSFFFFFFPTLRIELKKAIAFDRWAIGRG